jgi:hypothetical protein
MTPTVNVSARKLAVDGGHEVPSWVGPAVWSFFAAQR